MPKKNCCHAVTLFDCRACEPGGTDCAFCEVAEELPQAGCVWFIPNEYEDGGYCTCEEAQPSIDAKYRAAADDIFNNIDLIHKHNVKDLFAAIIKRNMES